MKGWDSCMKTSEDIKDEGKFEKVLFNRQPESTDMDVKLSRVELAIAVRRAARRARENESITSSMPSLRSRSE